MYLLGLRRRLPAWRSIAWVRGAEGVVELPAGSIDGAGVATADIVRLEAL